MKFAILAGALAVTLACTAPAVALTVTEDASGGLTGGLSGNTLNVAWTTTPTTVYISFTVDAAFDFSLADYDLGSSGSSTDVSGYTLDILDGPDGTATTRLTTMGVFCSAGSGGTFPVSAFGGVCDLVTATGNGGNANANAAAKPGDVLFAGLGAGSYRFGFFDSSSPPDGSASFAITAVPVPAPATLALLGAGLLMGGLGLRRRAA